MNDQLKAKAKTLPPQIYDYLDSLKSDDLNVLIIDKYRFDLPQLRSFYDLIARLFLKEITVAGLVDAIKQIFGFTELVARQLACDIAGVRLLVVVEWLGEDMAGLIRSWGGDPAKYQSYTEIQRQALPREAKWRAEQLAEPPEPEEEFEDDGVDWEEREKRIKEFFTSDLAEILSLDDDAILAEFNDYIFHLILNVREEIKDELTALLLNNQEVLTTQRIVVDGKQVPATVANWLACFVKEKGGALFDAVVLSDFITNSPNAKFLDYDEKKLLSNLLITYRNLKFFPDSLESPDPKYWAIFPVAVPEEPLTKTAGVTAAPADIDLTRPLSAASAPKVFPKIVPVNPEEEAKRALVAEQIAEAESLLTRYPAGSLERLALEEELDKLRKI